MRSKHAAWMFGLVLLACVLPGAAMASSSRVQSLGLQGDYILDYSNVQMYPSAIARYQNLVYGDLGVKDATDGLNDLSDFQDNNASFLSEEGRAMGAILGNLFGGKIGSFGIFLNENASPISQALGAQYFNRSHNEAWNLVWGYKFSQIAVGLKFDRTFSSAEWVDTLLVDPTVPPIAFEYGAKPYGLLFDTITSGLDLSVTNSRDMFNSIALALGSIPQNSLGFGGGFSFNWEMDGRSNTADFSAEFRKYTHDVTVHAISTDPATFSFESDQHLKDNGGLSYAFNGRAHIQTADAFQVVPVVNFYRLDMSEKQTLMVEAPDLDPAVSIDTTIKTESKVTAFNVGLAGQWKLRESDWLTLGVAYQSVKMDLLDSEAKISYTTVPNIFGALESNLWPWLTLRLGASKPAYSRLKFEGIAPAAVVNPVDGEPFPEGSLSFKDSPFQYAVGLGFHLGHIDLDAVLNQDFAFTGGALAGNSNSEIPFTHLSATYRW